MGKREKNNRRKRRGEPSASFLIHKKRRPYISWRLDETYVKIKGKWHYLYRAVDKDGDTLDFMLSENRDEVAAFKFLKKVIGSSGLPDKINVDKSGSNGNLTKNKVSTHYA